MDFNRIITELCWRLEDGTPDFNNPEHLQELRVVLTMHKWTNPAINELMETLTEERTYVDNSQNRQLGRVGKKWGSSPGDSPKKSKAEPGEEPKKAPKAVEDVSSLDPESRIPDKDIRAEMEEESKKDSKQGKEIREMFEAHKTLPDGDFKDKALFLVALGQTYSGRDNAGWNKNRFGMADRDQLNRNKQNLLELYDEAKPEKVEKGVRAIRKNKVTEEFVKEAFDTLPPKLQNYLKGAGSGGKDVGNGHFLGYKKKDGTTTSDVNDPDIVKGENGKPEIVRGNVGTEARALLVWRIYLEQGGVDAYTGLPLDLGSMDLEHVVGLNNKDNGDPKQHYNDRENDANFVITSSRGNQNKGNDSMEVFYQKKVDPLKDKTEEDFKKLDQASAKVGIMQPRTEQTAMRLMEEVQFDIIGGSETISQSDYEALPDDEKPKLNTTSLGSPQIASANLGSKVTGKSLQKEFDFEESEYETTRNTLNEQLTNKKDKEKIAAVQSKLGKRVLGAMGLAGNVDDESGRRTTKLGNDNFYKGFALTIAHAPPEDRERIKAVWKEARVLANKRDSKGNLVTGKRNKKNQKNEFIKYIRSNVDMPPEVLEDPRYKKLWAFE